MTDLRIATMQGTDTVLTSTAIEAFRTSVRGELLRPVDAGYDDARKVWNGMIGKRPALIIRCAGVADVITAVQFARTHNLLVAVRGGGHSNFTVRHLEIQRQRTATQWSMCVRHSQW